MQFRGYFKYIQRSLDGPLNRMIFDDGAPDDDDNDGDP